MMYANRRIDNSYYHHTCLIIPEQDVLEADISGTGFASRIARWWTDLFLLSYTSGRSTGFYNSTHAMRIERFKHFRKYKSRIHPMSKFRNFWDCLILHVFIINKILFRFTSTFIYDDLSIGLFYLGAFLELIIIVDLYVTLKTGYINHETKRVVLDAERCLVNFCKTKLFIHYVSAIPLHWFLLLKYGSNVSCGLCKAKANKFMSQKYGPNSLHVAFDVSRICNPSLLFRLGFKDKMHYLDQFAALIGYILNKAWRGAASSVHALSKSKSKARSQSEGLVIIDNGVLAVYSETHKEQGHLIDGDYFGALSLVTDKELCMSFVVAITTCNVSSNIKQETYFPVPTVLLAQFRYALL
ncbi:hypothetical protein B5X24_HaOG203054 [Helicoverpa armigera]|uniref:Cyclic nucleotide-binding domain-containing protein n=1 Tax=Helicoverpa armigera TaxID=29058 RepID=A0A2W1BWW1_HELAM|nr:hypothetical protein B5X24_HaOG203054 [Helicoverpa armigera]